MRACVSLTLLSLRKNGGLRVVYNFRQSANIEVPRPRTEIGQSSFMHTEQLCAGTFYPIHVNTLPVLAISRNFERKIRTYLNCNAISFDKASCIVSYRSADFKYF